ncbi:MAG TPA: tRNA lysidine(34) synthetase TilS [Steroidobacteraceae bacterium]|jgi:tRNA(Ile)-lysidine synthase
MSFSPPILLAAVERHLPAAASGSLCVGFSGGLDSTALLQALAVATRDHAHLRVRAIHIDHQIHPSSGQWQMHCAQIADAAGVPYLTKRVSVPADCGTGPEAAARTVRYAALRELLDAGETLITAHHADDQLETMLLALLRGAGTHGLAGMPVCQAFGSGWHLRPLLEVTRVQIESWASDAGLQWITDPSNSNTGFSRNYLRHEVVPVLQRRWPAVATTAARAARHLGDANELLDAVAAADLAGASVGECLSVASLRALEPSRRSNMLRYWLRERGARLPSTRKLAALEHDMLAADANRLPYVAWDDFEVRRHRGLLYGGPALPQSLSTVEPWTWDWRAALPLGAGSGLLRTQNVRGAGLALAKLPPTVQVGFRRGGERLQLAGHSHRRDLKKLLQEADILPWWRDRIPLLSHQGALIAVADLWIAEGFAARGEEQGVRVVWEDRPSLLAAAAGAESEDDQ